MHKLKEFYQYKRELKKNKSFSLNTNVKSPVLVKKLQPTVYPFSMNCQAILHLRSTFNNTIATLTNMKGKVIYSRSCGCLGFSGKKKRTTKFAVQSTVNAVLKRAKDLGFLNILLHLNGFAKGRFSVLSCLKENGIKPLGIRDITPIPHNGCRPKKVRRG